MRLAAALVLGAVLVTSGCGGGKAARSAAAVAPASTVAFVALGSAAEPGSTRQALALLPGGARVQAMIDRVAWARIAPRVEVAILGAHRAVAYARPPDRGAFEKRLDRAGLFHARVSGWIAFVRNAGAIDAAKQNGRRLSETGWYRDAADAAAGARLSVLTHRGARWTTVAADGAIVRRTRPGGGVDAPHPLARRIPANAVAAASAHAFAQELKALPFAQIVERGFGLRLADVGRATPGSAVMYLTDAMPFPLVSLIAERGTVEAAARVAQELDPVAPAPVPAQVDGVTLNDVAFGALDLYYGRVGEELILTFDSGLLLRPGDVLQPAGLPSKTSAWVYLDAQRAPAALARLAALGNTALSRGFLRRLAGLRSVLAFETHTHLTTSLTVTVTVEPAPGP